ncbi:hypothetical protein ACIBQ1_17125 [Nonomuraea sp. NPDC050153]|uniref:hypothetical protein n=1 Tax=Nonomuraea sp. NPDC050153 TaxID=3364359 RepID=UPI0037A1F67B
MDTGVLQFPDKGLEVDLPIPVAWARLRIGQFNSQRSQSGRCSSPRCSGRRRS